LVRQFFWSRTFLFSILLLSGIYGGILYGTMRYLNVFTNHGEEVAVPNLIGLSAVDAKLKLESLGLSYEVLDSIPFLDEPSGIVKKQFPLATSLSKVYVKSNRVVGLRLSTNHDVTEMPDLLYNEVEFAKEKLERRGLDVHIDYKPTTEADGSVLEQKYNGSMIPSGTRISKGSKITLVVGRNEIGVRLDLPNFVGMNYSDAVNLLTSKGFQSFSTICNDCETQSDTLNALVFGQSPEYFENKMLERSKHITILINAGSAAVENPFE